MTTPDTDTDTGTGTASGGPRRGQTVHLLGNLVTFILRGADTGMRFSMVEARTAPGAGSPPHLHHADEESFHVLEGTYEIALGAERRICGPGSLIHVAKGVPHAFTNVGEGPARMLILNWPADHHERFFLAAGEAVPDGTRDVPPAKAPDLAPILAAARNAGIEILPPPG